MSETPESSASRRGLSPAAWGAISAIAVAVVGAVATLTSAWWQRPAPSATAPPPAAPAAAAAKAEPALPDPTTWAGSYSGQVIAPDGSKFEVTVQLRPGCVKGANCGTISVPHVPCKGRLTLAEVRPEGAEFSVDRFDEHSDRQACQPGAGEVLNRRPDGDLEYAATYSGAKGVLFAVD